MMDILLQRMNGVLVDWKTQYDVFSSVFQEFSLADGMIQFGALPLCQANPVPEFQMAEFDANSIDFLFDRNRIIHLQIEWPEDSAPVVCAAGFMYRFAEYDVTLS